MISRRTSLLCALLTVGLFATDLAAQQVQIDTTRDSAFFDFAPNNNYGGHFFLTVGVANNTSTRRGVFFFDVAAAVPAGATITGATFEFDITQQGGGQGQSGADVALHEVTNDWAEGTGISNTGSATLDGCSWLERMPGVPWDNNGGDFDPSALGSVFVNNPGGNQATFAIASADLVAVTQNMLDNPSGNFGFLLKNIDETITGSAFRLTTREDGNPANNGQEARLIIDFTMGGGGMDVPPSSLTLFRGILVSGTLADTLASDDQRYLVNPGFTLNSLEAPAWLIFDANLSTDSPSAVETVYEAQAGTPGLTGTLEAFNWGTNSYDILDLTAPGFNNDIIVACDLTVADHVQPGTAAVRTRIGWRQTGFTLNFPWEIRVDQVLWFEE